MALGNEVVFLIIAEVFFLGLVATGAGLLIVRRQLRKAQERSERLNQEVSTLRQRLQLTHQHLQTANERIQTLQNAQAEKNDPLLLNYQQRVANLEKFKELYFELEDRLMQPVEGDTHPSRSEVEERVRELEVTESRLQKELNAYAQRVKDMEARQLTRPAFGAVRIKEVEEMNQRLKARESEIRHLRQECDTIGIQYEELAAKSLELAQGRGDLTDEQKVQLAALKQSLEENAAALARKQAECEMLENCYLELEQNAQSTDTAVRMQQSYVECNTLQEQRRSLNDQVESAAGPEAAAEMARLREILSDRESSLNDIREQYREIKEQFIAVAQEENDLREANALLTQECEQLRQDLEAAKASHQSIAAEQKELEKLRAEYSKMESRYLALAKKVQ